MPSIDPSAGLSTAPAAAQTRKAGSNLDKDAFLKLFAIQMQHQDPSSPMDDSQMMAQMAQFSTLEQISNLADNSLRANVISLIGKKITYTDADGKPVSGTVEKVSTSSGTATLTVDGIGGVDPATVTEVAK